MTLVTTAAGCCVAATGSAHTAAGAIDREPSAAVAVRTLASPACSIGREAAVIGHIPAGRFPREMALVPGGSTLLVTNFLSAQLEAVSVPTVP